MLKPSTRWLLFVATGIFLALIFSLSRVLTPFLIATLLAYLADPIVEKMTRWHLPRLLSVIIVFLVLFIVITVAVLLCIALFQTQLPTLMHFIPTVIAWVQDKIMPWLSANFGIQETINIELVKTTLAANWTKAGGVASWLLKTVLTSGMTIVLWITNLLLIPVVTFYLLRDWKRFIQSIRNLLPRDIEPTVVELVRESDLVLSAFFRGQLLVMLALGIVYSVGLTMVGLQIGIVIGLIAGLLSVVPYLGFIVGIASASIAAYIQMGSLTAVLLVWLTFIVGQALESTILTPKLVGGRIGLHPVAVILAVLTGAALGGFFGVLLALPVAAVLMVWLRYLNQRYKNSRLYQS